MGIKSPEWVIDVNEGCIIPGEGIDRYIALSYTWGTDVSLDNYGMTKAKVSREVATKLLESNLSDFQNPGFLHHDSNVQLSQTIKDAIELVAGLEMGYLWVDCLCLIQDAPDIRKKVEKMDEVYSGAYFTLVAAVDSTLSEAFNSPDVSEHNKQPEPEQLFECLQQSRWAQRGWTFQEAILSRRIVIFVEGHVFWDCPSCVWNPNDPKKDTHPVSRGNDWAISTNSYQRSREVDLFTPNFGTWFELICLYNHRQFTYPQDIIDAFSVIVNLLSPGFLAGFVYGLPFDRLDVAMSWQPRQTTQRRKPMAGSRMRYLPSWSCFGWDCQVNPYSLRSGLPGLTLGDGIDHAASWRTYPFATWSLVPRDQADAWNKSSEPPEIFLKCTTEHAFFNECSLNMLDVEMITYCKDLFFRSSLRVI